MREGSDKTVHVPVTATVLSLHIHSLYTCSLEVEGGQTFKPHWLMGKEVLKKTKRGKAP